jgi:hypothetical protein
MTQPPSEPAVAGLSAVARVLNTFIAPSKTFSDIKRDASWWVPWLLLSLVTSCFLYLVHVKVGGEAQVNYRMSHASFMERATQQMTPEQKQQMIDNQVRSEGRSFYWTPLSNLIGGLVFAPLLMLTFNFLFDAQVKFKWALAIVFYGWLPKILLLGLSMIALTVGVEPEGFDVENPIASHLGVILGSNTDHRFYYHLLSVVDVFSIWCMFLMGLGFATVSAKKISTGSAVTAVAVWWLVFILIRSAFSPFAG